MARSSIEVELRIYQQLCDVYNRKFGESPKNLVQTLNQRFADERKAASAKNPHAKKDLVSERTIQNFFKDADGRKLSLVNLNYLCQVMLGGSYRDVLEGNTETPTHKTVADATVHNGYSSQKGLSLDAAIQLQEVGGQMETPPLETWLDAYQEQVRQYHSSVRIPAMRQARSLESVYVDAGLSKDLKIRKKKDFLQLLQELEGNKQEVSKVLTVPEILRAHRRTMIWGAAGAGKTTLLKNIVCHPHVIGEIIPVFIVLADYARALETNGLSLVAAVHKEFRQSFSRISGNCPRLTDQGIDTYLKRGDFFVVLDGLDEVPTKALSKVQDQVANLVKQHPGNHYVLACRFGTTDYVPQDFIEVEVALPVWLWCFKRKYPRQQSS
ncbi:NACHT domain-containing protein [Leptolyngbya sp. PCC 6406]|uniref:NACHT domain-containing protein n=1 Tax=Leptolyngbya sp. PCC 6406 TaxID=1173264 RepID=UPI0002AC92E0|nr:NTPase (NACHT family) [Leptolyngbya sp. PCC 6406]